MKELTVTETMLDEIGKFMVREMESANVGAIRKDEVVYCPLDYGPLSATSFLSGAVFRERRGSVHQRAEPY